MLAIRSTEWSGPLPPPETLAQYDPSVRSRIIEWSDVQIRGANERASFTAETERIAVERGANARTLNLWLSFAANALSIAASLAAFITTDGNPVSFGFLAVPCITIAVNVARVVREGKGK